MSKERREKCQEFKKTHLYFAFYLAYRCDKRVCLNVAEGEIQDKGTPRGWQEINMNQRSTENQQGNPSHITIHNLEFKRKRKASSPPWTRMFMSAPETGGVSSQRRRRSNVRQSVNGAAQAASGVSSY
ncbi:uncharacterized protein ACB058_021436 [Synchiropus picturatus]